MINMASPELPPLDYALRPKTETWGSTPVRRARIDGRPPSPIDPEIVERVRSSYVDHQNILHPEEPQREPFWKRVKRSIGRKGGKYGS